MQKNNIPITLKLNSTSLLIPCYNASRYIDSFLKHINELNLGFDEIIFYDDASTDDTVSKLENNNQKVIIGQTNKGPGYARNQLAKAAKSNFIHFHDIDDEFNPNFLDLVNFKLNERDYDVIIGFADWIDEKTRKSQILWEYNIDEINLDKLGYFISHPLGIINTVYKKKIFYQSGGFNQDLLCWEDADLHVKLAALNVNFGLINEVIAYSIRHNNGVSQNQKKCWHCRLNFLAIYLKQYPNHKNIIAKQIVIAISQLIQLHDYKKASKGILLLNKINQLEELSSNFLIKKVLKTGFPALPILVFKNKVLRLLSNFK